MQPQGPLTRRFLTAVVTVVLLSGGCRKPPAPVVKTFAGTIIRVAVPNGPARKLFDHHGVVWARAQSATIQFVAENPDVIVFSPAELGQRTPTLAPVPDAITSSGSWAGFSRLYRNKLLLWGDTAYALPLLGDATVLVYRADLYAAAKLKPPATNLEFADHARRWKEQRKRPSLPPLDTDDRLDREFHAAAAAFAVPPLIEEQTKTRVVNDPAARAKYAFQFDVDTAKPRLTEPGFGAALGWMQQIQETRSTRPSWAEAFANDEAVLGFASVADVASLKSGTYGFASLARGAGGEVMPYAGPGGWIAGVAKSSANTAAAFELLQHLSSTAVSLEVIHDPSYGAAPFRGGHFTEQREGWFNYGLGTPGTDQFRDALSAAIDPRVLNAPFRLRVARQELYRKELLAGVRHAVETNRNAAEALAAIAAKWPPLDPMEYQRSLNLRP